MKLFTILAVILLAGCLPGCNALGGIPPEAIANAKNAGASCIRVGGLWGHGVVTTANADKGVLIDGQVTINPDNCGMTITNTDHSAAAAAARAAAAAEAQRNIPGPEPGK